MRTRMLPASLAQLLATCRSVVVVTGAGVSAESGIPTFRDAHTGLWARYDPLELASPQGFARNPQRVWDWYQWRRARVAACRPNAGHQALAAIESRFAAFTLITQNVDGFHRLAGSKKVLELHGNLARTICSQTRREIDAQWLARYAGHSPVPSPHHAAGLARPDVVWFGEALDPTVLEQAVAAVSGCELLIVAGTSGTVRPAADLPFVAHRAGARVCEINPAKTPISALADWHLVGGSATWLPLFV